jgi:hypothetical protein
VSHTVLIVVTSGGFAGTIGVGFRLIYQLGSILESFRQHVKSSDLQHSKFDERLTFMERRGH